MLDPNLTAEDLTQPGVDPSRTLTMCGGCGKKNCPEITEISDGSFVLADPDVPGCGPVALTRDQATELLSWLSDRLK